MGLIFCTWAVANNPEPTKEPKAPKQNLTEMVISHIAEHGILTEQELADFTAVYRSTSQQKSVLNKENRAIKKELSNCKDNAKMIELIKKVADNDLKRAQLDCDALNAYIEKINPERLVQVLQCSENYKNELFKNMRMKRHKKAPQPQK